ncbi:MAG: futalosine hydrolase [Bacteroidales bacterium]|nr:futalosine hydrolase [Bacteroidales bacterium]
MKILVVSATEKEIFPALNKIKSFKEDYLAVDVLVTGIGAVFTTYSLSRKLSEKEYDLVINAGIAGSFNPELKIGDTVYVESDQFADLGIEHKNEFYTVFEKGFSPENKFPFKNALLENPYEFDFDLKKVSAITVNTTHGCKKSIDLFKNKFKADIETMEGAGFFYVCLNEGVKFLQIRSISNYVEERNEAKWNIPIAIKNLNQQLLEIIDVIIQEEKN